VILDELLDKISATASLAVRWYDAVANLLDVILWRIADGGRGKGEEE